jgi:hypothetical protein
MLIWFSSTAYYPYGGLGFGHRRHERLNQHQRNNICMHINFLACTTWYYISKSSCPDSIRNRVCFSKDIPKSRFCPWSRKRSYMCDCLVERTLQASTMACQLPSAKILSIYIPVYTLILVINQCCQKYQHREPIMESLVEPPKGPLSYATYSLSHLNSNPIQASNLTTYFICCSKGNNWVTVTQKFERAWVP